MPAKGSTYLYPNELDRLLRKPGGPIGRHCNYIARSVANESSRIAAERGLVRDGRYIRGFKVRVDTNVPEGFQFYVYNRVTGQKPIRKTSYAAVLEYGSQQTAPHTIRPRNTNGWLVFRNSKGALVRVKSVQHPGVRPYHVMRDAMYRTLAKVRF
jgi:hypothetical protein